jgi:hypothetical protein
MELKQLVDELRNSCNPLLFLNGCLGMEIGTDHFRLKSEYSDEQLIRFAATCPECDVTASEDRIKSAIADAKDAESFWAKLAETRERNEWTANMTFFKRTRVERRTVFRRTTPKIRQAVATLSFVRDCGGPEAARAQLDALEKLMSGE